MIPISFPENTFHWGRAEEEEEVLLDNVRRKGEREK
jgi:hypothetical protein